MARFLAGCSIGTALAFIIGGAGLAFGPGGAMIAIGALALAWIALVIKASAERTST